MCHFVDGLVDMPHRNNAMVRALLVIAYILLLIAAGFLLWMIQDTGLNVIWKLMSYWLIGGSALSAVGQIRKRWTWEFIGLPLIASSLFGLGVLQGAESKWTIYVIPSVAILWAFAFISLSRWKETRILYKVSTSRQGSR